MNLKKLLNTPVRNVNDPRPFEDSIDQRPKKRKNEKRHKLTCWCRKCSERRRKVFNAID